MVILVMGVTGAGKTTVGGLLAKQLGWPFLDADDFHPPENIEKMKHGIPLTDADREPWLAAIHQALVDYAAKNQDVVLACSALKQSYRELLWRDGEVKLVYLKGTYELIAQRLLTRRGHFADEHILAGQFADLEEPTDALVVDISATPEAIVDEICRGLALPCKTSSL